MTAPEPATMRGVPMPAQIAALPRNHAGYPIPYFVSTAGGVPEFRVMTREAIRGALIENRCWVCGQPRTPSPLGIAADTFVIGPMCIINRISAEPPSHADCAEYSARVCPFLTRPGMARRTTGLPDDTITSPGALDRNPGVALVYTASRWQAFRPDPRRPSLLFDLDGPVRVSWWREGRPADHDEVWQSILSGLPTLYAEAAADPDPAAAVRDLTARVNRARMWLPAPQK